MTHVPTTVIRELGMNVAHCNHGFEYLMVDKEEIIVEKSQVGFLYTDDVGLIESNEHDMLRICIVFIYLFILFESYT